MSTSTSRAPNCWIPARRPGRTPSPSNAPAEARTTLTLDNGTPYPTPGKLEFSEVTVDAATGAITLRAVFPNPDGILLPGMFVRATIMEGSKPDAILAPQQAIGRTEKGDPTAYIVDAKGFARLHVIKVGQAIGDKWLVLDGLKAGDKLIVEGLQNVQADAPVHAVPAGSKPAPQAGRPRPELMGLSQFFIERPVFAWVIAIVIVMFGIIAINILPITQYPTIAPPAVTIVANYPGADAQTVQNSVTQVIEQQLTGVDNLLLFLVVLAAPTAPSRLPSPSRPAPILTSRRCRCRTRCNRRCPSCRNRCSRPA